ncbi:MAG: FkbM family methyltransferase [Actinomycetota bacterium]
MSIGARINVTGLFNLLGKSKFFGSSGSEDADKGCSQAKDPERMRWLLGMCLTVDSNCIDVGAHEGIVLDEILRVAPLGRHIAYEPIPHLARALTDKYSSVDVRARALSNRCGTSQFFLVKTLPGYSGLRRRSYPSPQEVEELTVEVEDLDSSIPPGYVPAFIKIDVEGAEKQVLEGAIATISKHKPLVFFEHGLGAADHYGTSPEDIFALLCAEAGLRIFDLEGEGPYDLARFESTFAAGRQWNFVAHR